MFLPDNVVLDRLYLLKTVTRLKRSVVRLRLEL
jgi:hypothetical protein